MKPDISLKEPFRCDELESNKNQLDNDTKYVGNEMDDFLDDDYSDDVAFSKPKVKKKHKIRAKSKQKGKKKILTDGQGKSKKLKYTHLRENSFKISNQKKVAMVR